MHMYAGLLIMMDDDVSLPADTLAILNEFLLERSKREAEEENQISNKTGKDGHFEEDWQLSQFWYNTKTKLTLRDVVGKLLAERKADSGDFHIALLSCPSLYKDIKNIHDKVHIFEYDQRFGAYGTDFVHYDLNCIGSNPDYLKAHHHQYDLIVADPPFLSQECIANTCEIITRLQNDPTQCKLILCSGKVVEPWLTARLPVLKCKFQPEHERNLGNEFVSYANFNLDKYIENK
ncbi:protein-lysine N-methyltransferase CG9154 [Drosophila rhopaloa]|uniref:Protein-lysine N-methyltransferase LOC108038717 n=1 Tax=Drosophila rhopaloa TaxID=1041015 RepID=A0A6P4DZN8_DRORH|nr:protein-lysine N-methyltransferase CG9154 [Drosophila rhopaloa]